MKYIITFEDEPCLIEEGLAFYKCEEAPWWSASDRLISKLTPYGEAEGAPEKIEVGDEVTYGEGEDMETFIVTRISDSQAEGVATTKTDYFEIGETNFRTVYDLRKTGRHFDLPWMEGEHEEA